MRIIINLVGTFILFFSTSVIAQKNDIDKLEEFMNQVRTDPSKSYSLPQLSSMDPFLLIENLSTYQSDTIHQIRRYSYSIANRFYSNTANDAIKKELVTFMSSGLSDKNSGNCGIVNEYLLKYPLTDFNSEAKNKIFSSLKSSSFHFQYLIKLIGFLQMEEATDEITNILTSEKTKSNKIKWAAQLALARMGNDYYINRCLTFIKDMEVNDDLIYDFLPDLIYIKQKAAIDYLIELLMSDEKNCESADPESREMILCAYRIMEYLAPVLHDFPLEINASGDIKTENYTEALNICREWFLQNPNYEIITTKY